MAPVLNAPDAISAQYGQYEQALLLHQRALAIVEEALGSMHPLLASCLENQAALLELMHQPAQATECAVRAQAIRAKQSHTD